MIKIWSFSYYTQSFVSIKAGLVHNMASRVPEALHWISKIHCSCILPRLVSVVMTWIPLGSSVLVKTFNQLSIPNLLLHDLLWTQEALWRPSPRLTKHQSQFCAKDTKSVKKVFLESDYFRRRAGRRSPSRGLDGGIGNLFQWDNV